MQDHLKKLAENVDKAEADYVNEIGAEKVLGQYQEAGKMFKNIPALGELWNKQAPIPENYAIKNGEASFPISKVFVMTSRVDHSYSKEISDAMNGLDTSRSMGFPQASKAVTEDMAITQFVMTTSLTNDSHILMLFSHPESVEFEIAEEQYIALQGQRYTVKRTVIRSGAELKTKLLEDSRMKETHAEILRVKMKAVKDQEEKINAQNALNRENWYHQWKWLEAKKQAGEFDALIEKDMQFAANLGLTKEQPNKDQTL